MKGFASLSVIAAALALEDGIYSISVRSSGLELQANDLGDGLVSTRFQSHDGYAKFKVAAVDGGAFRLSVLADDRLVHADDLGTFQVGTVDVEDEYTHFEVTKALLGGYKVRTVASGRAWTLDSQGLLTTSSGSGVSFDFTASAPARGCFRDIVWDESEIQVIGDVEFGSAVNPATGKTEVLHLDAYLPPSSDARKLRPAAVLVHGGGFTDGDRTWDGQVEFAKFLARRGYVAVSIDYRLLGGYFDLSTSDEPGIAAAEDARAAIRYVRKMASEYNIDPDRIMIEGDSAGAITSLYLGYADVAQGEGHSGNPGYRSDVRLAIPVSGQMKSQAYCDQIHPSPANCQVDGNIDHTGEMKQGQPALFMIHGTEDYTVPYVNGKAVFDRAQAVGIPSALVTIEGGMHVPWADFYGNPDYVNQMLDFAFEHMDLANAECPHRSSTVV